MSSSYRPKKILRRLEALKESTSKSAGEIFA